jgi:hypothetical protein
MHWGKISRFSITVDHNDDIPIRTWALTMEPDVLEPPLLLDEAKKAGLAEDVFTTCGLGETVTVEH